MSMLYREVSPKEALKQPYPYVYVNEDGSVRELHPREREYLETPFAPFDGNLPYVKWRYGAKDGWGSIAGYCRRYKIFGRKTIGPAPIDDPFPPMTKEDMIALTVAQAKKAGYEIEVIANPDGTIAIRRIGKPPSKIKRYAAVITIAVTLLVLLGLFAPD
jgi:hypothetical protein